VPALPAQAAATRVGHGRREGRHERGLQAGVDGRHQWRRLGAGIRVTGESGGAWVGGATVEAAMRELLADEGAMRSVGDGLDGGADLPTALRDAADLNPARAAAIGELLASPQVLDDLAAMFGMLLGTGSDVEGRPPGPSRPVPPFGVPLP
jgi:hypothetical protein